jgi:transposase
MANFKQMPVAPDQLLMFPVSVDASIPEGSDVRVLGEAMDLLDWSVFESGYCETGCPAYPPRVLAKILVYGYSKGIRSSRRLEDAVINDKRFIWLAGGLEPDHCTISRFRKEKGSALKDVYKETVRVCVEAGLVLLNVTSTDGSKIESRASKRSLYDAKRLARESEAIERIFREADAADAKEDEMYGSASGNELPEELADAVKRKAKLAEIAERLRQSRRKSVSASDAEAHVMKTNAGLRPAYNVQVSVDSANLVIVAADVSDEETDRTQLPGQLEQIVENVGARPDVALADTGYSDEVTYKSLESTGQEALIPPRRQPQERKRNDLFASKCFVKDESKDALICPAGRELAFRRVVKCSSGKYKEYRAVDCRDCSFYRECVTTHCKNARAVQISVAADQRQKMIDRLKGEDGKKLYSLRRQTVELVFAGFKANMGFRRFGLHGKSGAGSETWLLCITHNLGVYVRKALSAACACLRGTAGRPINLRYAFVLPNDQERGPIPALYAHATARAA